MYLKERRKSVNSITTAVGNDILAVWRKYNALDWFFEVKMMKHDSFLVVGQKCSPVCNAVRIWAILPSTVLYLDQRSSALCHQGSVRSPPHLSDFRTET